VAQSLKSLSDRNDSSSTYSNGIKDLVNEGMIHNSGEGTKDRDAPLQETMKRGGSFTEALLNTCQICEGMIQVGDRLRRLIISTSGWYSNAELGITD